jgi:uncharacterized membrane protein
VTVTSVGRSGASTPRWLVTGLLASLALNLVLIGTAAGFIWRHFPSFQAGETVYAPPTLLNYASTLPPQRFKGLMTLTDEERQNVRPLRQQLREAREEMVKALTAEPFDKARLQAAQERLLNTDLKAREAVYQLYTVLAVHMTPQERLGFANWRDARRKVRVRNLLDEPEKQAGGTPPG